MIIREYRKEDFKDVCKVYFDARKMELDGTCDLRAAVPMEDSPNKMDKFSKAIKYVALIDDKIAGFLCLNDSEISFLYVHSKYQRKGIGSELLKLGKQIVGEKAYLQVAIGNKIAEELYSRNGFVKTQEYDCCINGYNAKALILELK